jgi:TM2 domain-containing membrane protein YozV
MPPGQPNPGFVAPGPAYGALQPMPQPYGWAPPPDPMAPFGRDPITGQSYSEKSKVVAGLLQIFLGTYGVGRFYTGHTSTAVTMLVLSIVGILLAIVFIGYFMLMGVWIWSLIDGIRLLTGRETDAQGLLLRP